MLEFGIVVVVLVALVMFGGRITKSLDWFGNTISNSSVALDHGIEALVKQSARSVMLSDEGLDSSKLKRLKAKASYLSDRKEFVATLKDDKSKASITELEEWMAQY